MSTGADILYTIVLAAIVFRLLGKALKAERKRAEGTLRVKERA
jgi:hypothetical protein